MTRAPKPIASQPRVTACCLGSILAAKPMARAAGTSTPPRDASKIAGARSGTRLARAAGREYVARREARAVVISYPEGRRSAVPGMATWLSLR
jgi:hypothetical protein